MLLKQRLKIEGKNQMKINLDTFIFNSDWNFQITYKPAENINKQMIICTAIGKLVQYSLLSQIPTTKTRKRVLLFPRSLIEPQPASQPGYGEIRR